MFSRVGRYELTIVVSACSWHAQNQIRESSRMGQLMATGEENPCFVQRCGLWESTCSPGRSYRHGNSGFKRTAYEVGREK